MTDSKDLPPVWEALARAMKHQKLIVMQRDLDTAAEDMELSSLTIATPSLLKLVLALGFRTKIRDNLATGLQLFILSQYTAKVRKFLRGQAD